jgi:hypothetical protein
MTAPTPATSVAVRDHFLDRSEKATVQVGEKHNIDVL